MNINLENVRILLRETLGPDSFTALFLKSVNEDPNVPTACISADGAMRYSPGFVQQHVRTREDLFSLVFHELLHPAFGHFMHPNDALANVACDAIINATVTQLFARQSADGALFARVYPDRGLPALLRPDSQLDQSRFSRLYRHLYPRTIPGTRLSAGEVIRVLKILAPPAPGQVLLLGTHAKGSDSPGLEWPAGIARAVAGDLLAVERQSGQCAGNLACLQELLIEVLKSKVTIREDLLLRYSTCRKLDAFFMEHQHQRRITSPFPINPSRRDLAVLAAGVWPGFFRNRQPGVHHAQQGVAVFLDVSGSVNAHLPGIVGLLASYVDRLGSVHLFSNAVVEQPFSRLCRGQIATTHGTDFDCVAKAIIDKRYDRAVVITDGYASLADATAEALRRHNPRILTILFGGRKECPEFSPFGEVMQLCDVVDR